MLLDLRLSFERLLELEMELLTDLEGLRLGGDKERSAERGDLESLLLPREPFLSLVSLSFADLAFESLGSSFTTWSKAAAPFLALDISFSTSIFFILSPSRSSISSSFLF
jgi:hypothetical protein